MPATDPRVSLSSPELIDLRSLQDKSPNERLASAFLIAEQHLGVQRLIEPEGIYGLS